MQRFSRREFTQASLSALLTTAAAQSLKANPLGLPIGCQTYPVRELIAKDFAGTVKMLADAGFTRIELCSPKGYADAGFAPVGKYKGSELQSLLRSMNVECHSSHFDINELRSSLSESIDWAKSVGLTQMLVPSLDGPQKPTMDDVKKVADEFNKMGETVAAGGLQLGLHNEGFESSMVDGKRTYDVLFGLLNPQTIKFQFQCSEIAHGFIAADYFHRYPGRFISMHVQDWSSKLHKEVPVGKGVINWTKTFEAARVGGIKNYFVEMDFNLMKASVPYLQRLTV